MTSSEGTKGAGRGQADERRVAAEALLDDMEIAAHNAAQFIRGRAGDLASLTWQTKSPADFVSEVDTGAERIIRELLGEGPHRETHVATGEVVEWEVRVVGEESSPDASLSAAQGVTYVVDPLDGTTNFLHGYPWYAVSIGAIVGDELAAGLVMNVPTGETFTAIRGGGAFRNDEQIRVSENADPSRALIGTGFPFKNVDRLDLYQRQFAAVTRATAGIRRAGAAALDLCDVACGRFDAFWELSLAPWDVAAGILVIREAGGVVTDLDSRDARVGHGPLVAGSPAMHRWLMETLRA